MVDMRSTQLSKTSDIFEFNTQLVVFILNELQLFIFLQTKALFIRKFPYRQRIHFTVNTKSKNTKKNNNVFILKQKKHFFYIITFPGNTLIPLLTSKLITVDSSNRTNNSFGYLKCSNPNKKPSNTDANFESTRLKLDFSQTLSLTQFKQ